MGADTPAEGGDNKPTIKIKNKSGAFRRGSNKPGQCGDYIKKEKFLGSDLNLQGFIFEAKRLRSKQVANFERFDERIRMQIGLE